jgi:hypothetical protein
LFFIVKLIRLTSFPFFLPAPDYYCYYYGNVSDKNRFDLKVHFPYATETGGHATIPVPQAPPKRVATPLPWQHVTYITETFQKEKKRKKKAFVVTGGGRGDCAGAVPEAFSNQSRLSLSSIGAEVRDKTKKKREWVVKGGGGVGW